MKLSLFIFILILTIFSKSSGQNSALWEGLKKGPFEIGFKTVNFTDNSRQVIIDSIYTARPLQIAIWYPSIKGSKKMTMNTYFANYATHRDFKKQTNKALIDWARNETIKAIFTKTTSDSILINKLFNIPTEAYINAHRIDKKFPLIFLLSHVSTDLFLMAEYLTSHGYIVVSKYADGLITNVWNGWNSLANNVNNELIDLSLIHTFLSKEDTINLRKIGLIGYHGNISSLILHQITNKNVAGVVSLDGSEVWSFNDALKKSVKNHPAWDSLKINVPYLRIHSDADLNNSMDLKHADWWFYKATNNPVTMLNIHNLNHYDFLSVFNANTIVPGITGTTHKNPNKAHGIICNSILSFLNVNVKGSNTKWLDEFIKNNLLDGDLFKINTRKDLNLKQFTFNLVERFEKDLGSLNKTDIKSFDKAITLFRKYRTLAKNKKQVDSLFMPFFTFYNHDTAFLKTKDAKSLKHYGFAKIIRHGEERIVPTDSDYLNTNIIRYLSKGMQKFCRQQLKEFTDNNNLQTIAQNTIWWEFFNRDHPNFFLKSMSTYHYKHWHLKHLLLGTRDINVFNDQDKLLTKTSQVYRTILNNYSSSDTANILKKYLAVLKRNDMIKNEEVKLFLKAYE